MYIIAICINANAAVSKNSIDWVSFTGKLTNLLVAKAKIHPILPINNDIWLACDDNIIAMDSMDLFLNANNPAINISGLSGALDLAN